MPLFYSAAVGGFFDDSVHAALPPDAVAVTAARHAELLAGQAAGKAIAADKNGRPCLRAAETAPLGDRQARAARAARAEARRRILAIASIERQSNDNAQIALMALQFAQAGATTIDAAEALARRATIDAIRAACAALEARIATTNAHALAALEVDSNGHWPTAGDSE